MVLSYFLWLNGGRPRPSLSVTSPVSSYNRKILCTVGIVQSIRTAISDGDTFWSKYNEIIRHRSPTDKCPLITRKLCQYETKS